MELLINLILALIAGFLTRHLLNSCKVTDPIAVLVGILVGIVVFMADLAARMV